MNETLKVLKERRSIRSYKPEQITDAELNAILEAGSYAASGMNRQSAVMVVIQDKALISRLNTINAEIKGMPGTNQFYGAPTVIAVLADASTPTWFQDGVLVMGNLMNAAAAVGVGSCWIHRCEQTFEREDCKDLLEAWGLNENYRGIAFCILGYAEGDIPAAKPRKENYIRRA